MKDKNGKISKGAAICHLTQVERMTMKEARGTLKGKMKAGVMQEDKMNKKGAGENAKCSKNPDQCGPMAKKKKAKKKAENAENREANAQKFKKKAKRKKQMANAHKK